MLLLTSVEGIHVLILEAVLALVILAEERMSESTFDSDSLGRLEMHHLGQQVHGLWVILKVSAQFDQVLISVHLPFREGSLHLRKSVRALPIVLVGCTKALEDLENLTNFALTVKEGFPVSKLEENASN